MRLQKSGSLACNCLAFRFTRLFARRELTTCVRIVRLRYYYYCGFRIGVGVGERLRVGCGSVMGSGVLHDGSVIHDDKFSPLSFRFDASERFRIN